MAASFAVYSNAIFGSFVYDDHLQIEWNPLIRDMRSIPRMFSSNVWGFGAGWVSNYYRPVIHAIHTITFSVFGLQPPVFHLLNIGLHAMTSLFVYLFIREMLSEAKLEHTTDRYFSVPFALALLFALHPIHTEAVAWASALPEVSFSLFFIMSVYFYAKSQPEQTLGGVFYMLSVLFFLLALLSKEQAVTLPIVIICYDLLFRNASPSRKHLRQQMKKYVGYAVALAAYFILRLNALGFIVPMRSRGQGQLNLTDWHAFINIFPLFMRYIGKLLLPIRLNALYVYHVESLSESVVLISICFSAIFTVLFFILYRKNRVALFGLLLIVIPLSPALYLRAIQANTMAERYLYLPSLGFVLLAALGAEWMAERGRKWRRHTNVALVIFLCLCALGTVSRNRIWKDDFSLWSDTVRKSPGAALAHDGFGAALATRGRYGEAIREYRIALNIYEDAATHNNLGLAYEESDQLDKAVEQYELALAMNPLLADAYYNLGIALERKGLVEAAIEQYRAAIKIKPDSDAYFNLGNLLMNQGKRYEAMSAYEAALSLNPGRKDVANKLRSLRGEGKS